MIKLITKSEILNKIICDLPTGHYRDRIAFLSKCYGTDTDFCEFFESGKSIICIFEKTTAIIAGTPEDIEETGLFLSGTYTIDCDCNTAEKLLPYMDSFESLTVNFWEAQIYAEKTDNLNDFPNLKDAFEIVSSGFNRLDFNLWYTDTSHKIRHNLCKCYVYCNASSVNASFFENGIFLSQVSTHTQKRHKGYATRMLHEVKGIYRDKRVYLIAEEKRNKFYSSAGFMMTEKAGRLVRK